VAKAIVVPVIVVVVTMTTSGPGENKDADDSQKEMGSDRILTDWAMRSRKTSIVVGKKRQVVEGVVAGEILSNIFDGESQGGGTCNASWEVGSDKRVGIAIGLLHKAKEERIDGGMSNTDSHPDESFPFHHEAAVSSIKEVKATVVVVDGVVVVAAHDIARMHWERYEPTKATKISMCKC
jgi:hypothetical protein